MGKPIPGRTISPAFVSLLQAYLQSRGHDVREVLGKPQWESALNAGTGFPMLRWVELLDRASRYLRDPLLGLHLGQTITPQHMGTLGFLLQSVPTLGAALQKLQRYQRLVYDQTPMVQVAEAGHVDLVWGIDHGIPGSLADTASITALICYCRAIAAGPVNPLNVRFVNPAPKDLTPYRSLYGCPVEFGAAATRVRLSLATWSLPLHSANAALSVVMEQQAETLLALWPTHSDPFVAQLRSATGAVLHEGEPSLPRIAERLGIAPRTAQRRLQRAGTSFRTELEIVRRQMADTYLRDPRLSVSDIAQLLGYSEHSALTRSYRQWTGVAPRQRR